MPVRVKNPKKPGRKSKTQPQPRPAGPRSENWEMTSGWKTRLKLTMAKQGLSQRGLGFKANMGPTTVRHVVVNSQDIYLSTLANLADAMDVSVVWLATGTHAVPAGVGAAAQYPPDAVAVTVGDNSMVAEGLNSPPPLESIVVANDVAIYSPSAAWDTGRLVVANGPRGTLVRRAIYREDGKVDLVSNSHLYPKVTVAPKDVLGAVVAIVRKMG